MFFLQINGMRIQSGKIKRNQKKMEVFSTERTFGEDTHLSITCGKIIRQKYTQKEKKYSREELQKILTERFQEFREGTEKKGVQITGNSVKIHIGEESGDRTGSCPDDGTNRGTIATAIFLHWKKGTKPMSLSETMIEIPAEHEKNVFGQFDAYAKKLERTFHVTLIARDGGVKLLGKASCVESGGENIKTTAFPFGTGKYHYRTKCRLCHFPGL